MKVRKVGRLNDRNEVSGTSLASIVIILISNEFAQDVPTTVLFLPLVIGQGVAARQHMCNVPVATKLLDAQDADPVSLASGETFKLHEGEYLGAFIFRNQIFTVEVEYLEDTTEEEAILLIKKQAYSDDNRLKKLRKEVETIERVIDQIGIKRITIPETVKLLVYARDEGKCIRCGSAEKLHFDHIIPVSKGGGNSESNIQLLCEFCNLQKSDKIAF